jgi:aliphatic nitrilase
MDLVRYAMAALGEQIHAAIWPPTSAFMHTPHATIFNDMVEAMARNHAISAQVFVVCVSSVIDDHAIERLEMKDRPDMVRPGGGWTAVINPHGQIIAGPITEKESILIADVDLKEIVNAKGFCDSIGHYARPDVVHIVVNRAKQTVMGTRETDYEFHPPSVEEPDSSEQELNKSVKKDEAE